MPNQFQAEPLAAEDADLIARLREHDNPFDVYVQARDPQASFRRGHVPELNGSVIERLQAAINRYRLNDTAKWDTLDADDAPRTGVVVISGSRGAGKTHLLHELRTGDAKAVVIAPTHFMQNRPFAEYLLSQLVTALREECDDERDANLHMLANWFAKNVIVQALYGMTDTEWLGHRAPSGRGFWRMLLALRCAELIEQKAALVRELQESQEAPLLEILERRGDPIAGNIRQIAKRQIESTETRQTVGGQIRRGLYLCLLDLAFEPDPAAAFQFLEDGFANVVARSGASRETLVEELLQSLVDLFLLYGRPVVFAFDALETLLGDPLEERLARSFFFGLAAVIDSHRGIPLFVFAESGHWEQARPYISQYAQQRFQQGVPTQGYGPIHLLQMPPVTQEDLQRLIASRMAPLLAQFYNGHVPPDASRIRPFTNDDVRGIARTPEQAPPLRQTIQSLCERYNALVFNRNGVVEQRTQPTISSAENSTEQLRELWHREQRAAQRRIEAHALGALSDELHNGATRWLHCVKEDGAEQNGWTLQLAELKSVGHHPNYGQWIETTWQNGADTADVALALLLGTGSGLSCDLDTKLKEFARGKSDSRKLLVIWPRANLETAQPAFESLPPRTREVWDNRVTGALAPRVKLVIVDPGELAGWLALPAWEQALREEDGATPHETACHFIVEETPALLELVAGWSESPVTV